VENPGGEEHPNLIMTTDLHPFANPGRTKLSLVSRGVALPEGLSQPSRWIAQANAAETVIDIRLPSGHFCSVPVGQPYTEESTFLLHEDQDGFHLSCAGEEQEIELVEAPSFYSRTTRSGARMGSFASLHDKLLILNPLLGCGFFAERGLACHYCQYDSMLNEIEPPLRDSLDLVEVVRAALDEREVDTVYLYNGYAPGEDAGLARLVPIIDLLRRHLGHRQIALETVAPADVSVIDELYAAGLDIFVCNLELHDEERFAAICPGKQKHGGQRAIWAALTHARQIFRDGAVVSHLIPGLESLESTVEGMKTLVDHGVVPLLVPFRPLPGTKLENCELPSLDDVEQALLVLYELLADSGIPTHRLRDMGRVLTPMEGRALVGDGANLRERVEKWSISDPGRWLGGLVDRFRRGLRVQQTDGSKDL
jgi:sodium-dependent dicarboxylate transporter 2/3/5